jgi:formylglycine-generating enzyme required for sulfatase activity
VDKVTRQALIEALLTTIGNPQVALRVRIAAGDVLGHLGDPRLGRLETIPAGKFLMPKDEDQHELNLPAYRISQFPLTYAEYSPFIEAGGYKEKQWWTESGWNAKGDRDLPYHWHDKLFNKPNHPVIGISWYECVAYCRWLSHETGRLYRLPTEAEWMKASIGVKGWRYPWGDEFNSEYANTNEGKQTVLATTPVGIYQGKSPFDVFDCTGNVWEWCSTRWKIEHPFNTQENEWQEDYLEGTQDRVCRGGSFRDPPYPCSTRFQCSYNYTTKTIGFRVASLEAISDPEIV